jgi:hypothetical protein
MEDGCQRLPSRRRAPRAVESGAGAHTPGSTTGGAVTKEPPTIRVRRAVPRQLAPEGGDASCGAENQKKNQKTSDTRGRIGGFRTSVAHSANVRALGLRRLRRRPRQASPSGANAARGRAKSGSSAMPGKTPGKKICKSVFGSLIGRTQQRKNTVVRDIFPK